MNRRTLLGAIAALPFVKGATPAKAAPHVRGGPTGPVTPAPNPIPAGSKYTRTAYSVGQTYAPFIETRLRLKLIKHAAIIHTNPYIQPGDVVEIIDYYSDGHTLNYAARSVRTVVTTEYGGQGLILSEKDEGIREHDHGAYVRVISRASRGWLKDTA